MTLWLIFTAMIAAAAVLISAPFIRRYDRRVASTGLIEVYRDQLRELEIEKAEGLIDQAHADSASLEIKRRIIAAERAAADRPNAQLADTERRFALISVTSIVVFGAILLYVLIGSPELPSAAPQMAGTQPPVATSVIATQGLSRPSAQTSVDPAKRAPPQQAGLPPVEEMIQRVQARLERNPRDADGWRLLGWSLFNVERFADAAKAYARAIELRPESAEYRSARGEALVRDAGDTVTADARKEFEQALTHDSKDARARYFIGLAKEQDGDKDGAIADWESVITDADPGESWLPDLRQRLARSRAGSNAVTAAPAKPQLSADAVKDPTAASSTPPANEPDRARGPSADDVRNAQAMAPQDRNAMIRGMVDRLAARLEQQPRDAEGWIKLIRSQVVLGDGDLAKTSLQKALATFAEPGEERTRIADAAKQLGLDP
ncbi:MAG: c-type cytochrome biogenesis protein CcmI [Bradyrhizobium sp.]